jgi:hypothetical protein
MSKILINFRSTERERERFKHAAELERMSLSSWIRRLALVRIGELADRFEPENGSSTK